MRVFRSVLAVLFVVLTVYTAEVIGSHGWMLFDVFFGDIAKVNWPGQFNLDFMMMLALSASWVAWRHRFGPAGLGLGVLALFGGSGFLLPYLFIISLRTRGDVAEMLVGKRI
jgi:hypothetical protein